MSLEYTPLDDIEKIHSELRAGFDSGRLKSIPFRKYQLLQLGYLVKDNAKRFEDALKSDLGRPPLESAFLEIGAALTEVKTAYSNVDKWSKPERPPFSLNWTPMRPVIRKEAKGLVLIISPFNYPLWLSLVPLTGAIAAGNAVVLKPSESSPAVSALFAELIPQYLDPQLVRVVNGSIPETTKLLELKWDHILYTGSNRVGRIVAAAAAKHLTPVSLELGGKSPVFIDPKCDLDMCARRLLLGKCANAGQTCVAPDYVLVPKDFQETLVQALKDVHARFYPASSPPSEPGTFSRLVSPEAFTRVSNLLKNTKGTIVFGGEMDESTKYIAPTVVKDVKWDDSLMNEEIFGPLLPLVPIESLDEAIAYVNSKDHPLALYVFSQDPVFKLKVFDNTQSGACVANEVGIHPGAQGLPFGGVGQSGHGQHTGKFGFDMFTHLRASMDSPAWVDMLLGARYPPYTEKNYNALRKFFTSLPARPSGPPAAATAAGTAGTKTMVSASTNLKRWGNWFFIGVVIALAGVLTKRGRLQGLIMGRSSFLSK